MDNNLFQRIKELIEANQNIGVILPPNPSFDAVGAGLGLFLTLQQMKKNASIVCPTDVTVGVSSLVGVDKIQKTFGNGAGSDMIVSFPYKEGEIEKVSYDVEGSKLRIVIKAGQQGLSFGPSDVAFQQGGASTGAMPSLIFCIGLADMQQIGMTKTPGITIVNIDHRSNNTKYGDVVHVDSKFSSLSEEVADFLTLLEPQIELDVDSSQNLLSGILSATNDFQNGKGSYLAFEMAGILMKKGAVRSANGSYANPTTTSMPAANYFPPQPAQQPVQVVQPVAPVMQPVQQPIQVQQPVMQAPVFQQPVQQPVQVQQPIMQQPVLEQPVMAQPVQQPMQAVQQQPAEQPPADWLTPKVYKGSTVL